MVLIGDAEKLLVRANALIDDIDTTRRNADAVVERTDATVNRATTLVTDLEPLNVRLRRLLDSLEPSLTKLQPTLERLAETTDPHEVDAMVQLVDQLPRLADKLETDIMPILDSMNSVAPDLHDLLDVSRELNEMLGQVPGISRMKRRIDKQQAEEGRG
jgi:DNA repair ATPase RecN